PQATKLAEASRRPTIVPGTQVFEARGWLGEPIAAVQMLLSQAIAQAGDSDVAERLAAIEERSAEVLIA
ncbi:hypothetical protein, partial [Stenotrophomonas maltophilia]|uniref:hypothetical protein n=1 Tax=Stenotrophomonas maltophilia TaxID=40324 RepID=UPI0013DB4DF1